MPLSSDIDNDNDNETLHPLIGDIPAAGNPLQHTLGKSRPPQQRAAADAAGGKDGIAVSPEAEKLSVEELSAVLLAAEWSLAGHWAELTSVSEEARLQRGIAKLRTQIERLKAGPRRPR